MLFIIVYALVQIDTVSGAFIVSVYLYLQLKSAPWLPISGFMFILFIAPLWLHRRWKSVDIFIMDMDKWFIFLWE